MKSYLYVYYLSYYHLSMLVLIHVLVLHWRVDISFVNLFKIGFGIISKKRNVLFDGNLHACVNQLNRKWLLKVDKQLYVVFFSFFSPDVYWFSQLISVSFLFFFFFCTRWIHAYGVVGCQFIFMMLWINSLLWHYLSIIMAD